MCSTGSFQDGGEGHIGSLVESSSPGWWLVVWDGKGMKNSYRVGKDGKHDLRQVSAGRG